MNKLVIIGNGYDLCTISIKNGYSSWNVLAFKESIFIKLRQRKISGTHTKHIPQLYQHEAIPRPCREQGTMQNNVTAIYFTLYCFA